MKDEERVPAAKAELAAYRENAQDEKYRAAAKQAEKMRREQVDQALAARRNVITLPSLIVQREFAPARFGPVVGASTAVGQVAYAFAPVLAGLAHDLAGGYLATMPDEAAFKNPEISKYVRKYHTANPEYDVMDRVKMGRYIENIRQRPLF